MTKIGIAEIAKLANVSIGTVDRALHGRKGIRNGTRQRILELARSVGYSPNLAARALSSGANSIRIGVSIPREIHYYFDQLRNGVQNEASRAEHLGVQLIWRVAERLGFDEAARVRELIESHVSALILVGGDPQKLTSLIDEAESTGIRVICVDTDAPESRRSSVVCLDAEISGRLAAELMSAFVAPQAQVAVITGMLHTEDHRRKAEGFCTAFPKFSGGGSVADVIEAHDDEEEAFQKCFTLLENRSDLAGLYVTTANSLPVCRAIGALGMAGKVKLITTDLFREMQPYFEKGVISASIYARPFVQGQVATRLAIDHLVHGAPLPKHQFLAPQIVMRSTFHLFRETRPEGKTAPNSTVEQGTSAGESPVQEEPQVAP
jgi:LacI family transcriptional regulator